MASTKNEQSLPRTRSDYLDILRGIAIFGVVTFHTIQLTDEIVLIHAGQPKSIFTDFFNLGAYGVELFFVLSGWLLASIYQTEGIIGKSYWVRRLAKIMPLWVIFLPGRSFMLTWECRPVGTQHGTFPQGKIHFFILQ